MTTNTLAHSLPAHSTTTVTAFAPVAGFALVIDVIRDTVAAAKREASTPGPDKAARILKALHIEKAEMPKNERRM